MKRRILHKLKLTEISGVDRPCQAGAVVTIMKRAPDGGVDALAARIKKLQEKTAELSKFSPDQARANDGKWTRAGRALARAGRVIGGIALGATAGVGTIAALGAAGQVAESFINNRPGKPGYVANTANRNRRILLRDKEVYAENQFDRGTAHIGNFMTEVVGGPKLMNPPTLAMSAQKKIAELLELKQRAAADKFLTEAEKRRLATADQRLRTLRVAARPSGLPPLTKYGKADPSVLMKSVLGDLDSITTDLDQISKELDGANEVLSSGITKTVQSSLARSDAALEKFWTVAARAAALAARKAGGSKVVRDLVRRGRKKLFGVTAGIDGARIGYALRGARGIRPGYRTGRAVGRGLSRFL